MKLGQRSKSHKGQVALRIYADQMVSDPILQRFLQACPDAPTGMVPDLPVCLLTADVWSIRGSASQPSCQ